MKNIMHEFYKNGMIDKVTSSIPDFDVMLKGTTQIKSDQK